MMGIVPGCGVLDGVLVVRKEAGWTSHDVVAKVRRLFGGVKVGHAGTLDPAATGILPLLIGKGTRIAEYLMEWDKEYRAVLRLGETTDTQDATGTLLARQATDNLTRSMLDEAVAQFRGAIRQVPPMYSAVKVAGMPLYKSARAGKTVEREARTVHIRELDLLKFEGRDVTFRVVCSKGTYIRTLCADIGEALGVGGHLLALERRRVGPFMLEQARTVEEVVTRLAIGRLGEDLWSLDRALEGLPAIHVDATTASRVRHGAPVPLSGILRWDLPSRHESMSGKAVRIHDTEGRLLAVGRCPSGPHEAVAIEKMLVSQE